MIIDTGLGKRPKYTNVARVSSEEEARNREEEEEAGIMMARRTENWKEGENGGNIEKEENEGGKKVRNEVSLDW